MPPLYSYLYVEDDPLSREVMQTLLVEVMGVKNLTIFEDSHNFMARLKTISPPPDFILLDIHIMPHDGYELLSELRSDPEYARCKVLAVTAAVMTKEVEELKARGFDGAFARDEIARRQWRPED